MSGGFQTTPEQLTAAAAACETTAANVEVALGQLKSYVVGTEQWWQGIASTAFQELMVRYDMNSQKLREVLTEIAVRLRNNAANYGDGEQANLTTVTNIQQSLPAAHLG
jgi:WXG100 family type VII secretion target